MQTFCVQLLPIFLNVSKVAFYSLERSFGALYLDLDAKQIQKKILYLGYNFSTFATSSTFYSILASTLIKDNAYKRRVLYMKG